MQSYSFVELTKLSCGHLRLIDTERWSSIMKAVLLIACICITSAAAFPLPFESQLSDMYAITVDEARHCINKTNVVESDHWTLTTFQLKEVSEETLLKQDNIRRAMCATTCAAQTYCWELMIGAKLNLPKIHEFVDKTGLSQPEYFPAIIHDNIDICAANVKDLTDECEVGIKFIKCIVDRHPSSQAPN